MNKDLRLLFASQFLWAVGQGLYQYTWPVYVRSLGGGAVELGILTAVGFLSSAACIIPAGWLTDRFDRRWVLILGWAAAVPSPLLFAIARSWRGLIPGQVFWGFNMLPVPTMQAYVMDSVDPSRRAGLYSTISSAFHLGLAVSPGVGGFLAASTSMRTVFILAFAFYALSTIAIAPISSQKPSVRAATGVEGWLRWDWRLTRMCALFAFMAFAQTISYQFAVPYFQDVLGLDLRTVGLLGSLTSFGAFILAAVLGKLGDRAGNWKAIALSQAVMAGSLAVMLASRARPATCLAALARGYNGVPLMAAAVGEMAGGRAMGRSLALFNLVVVISMAAGPVLGGRLYEVGPSVPFLATIFLLAAPAAWILASSRGSRGREQRPRRGLHSRSLPTGSRNRRSFEIGAQGPQQ